MSGATCLDALQLAALIFGAIFGTLALCAGFALTVLYLATNRQCQFAQKVPGLEKIIALGEKCRANSKQNGANSKNNYAPNSKIHSELSTKAFATNNNNNNNNKPPQQATTNTQQQQQPTSKATTTTISNQQQQNGSTQTTVSRTDSMEEISLSDQHTAKGEKDSEAPPTQPISEYFDAQSTVTGHQQDETTVDRPADLLAIVANQRNDSNPPSKMNDPSMLCTDTVFTKNNMNADTVFEEIDAKMHHNDERSNDSKRGEELRSQTIDGYNNGGNTNFGYGIEAVDKSNGLGTISLTAEQCNVLEANRQKLETERQQLRQLGII